MIVYNRFEHLKEQYQRLKQERTDERSLTSEGTKGNRVLNTTTAKILPKKCAGTTTASEDGAIRPEQKN
jgi:hypothetical protein